MAYSATQLQLTHVLQWLYRRLGAKVTLATGGSTTTAVDTKLVEELQNSNVDDLYNGGTIIVIEDAAGAAAAPEGQFSRITDYEASSTTVTFSPALTALASGDRILITTRDFPLYDVIEQVNDALKDLAKTPRYDTSITTAANQTEYTLPVAVKGGRILKVEMQGITTDANDNRWVPVVGYRENYAVPGTAGTLVLPQFATGYTIRITYIKPHGRVDAYDDPIDEHFDPQLVQAAVMAHVLQWRNDADRVNGGADDNLLALEQKAWSQYDRAKIEHRPEIPPKDFQPFPSWSVSHSADYFQDIPLP